MPIDINGQTYYGPSEIMEMLGISRSMLQYYRREGHLKGGHPIGPALYHTMGEIEVVKEAIRNPKKRGAKPGKRQDNKDGNEGRNPSVMSSLAFIAPAC